MKEIIVLLCAVTAAFSRDPCASSPCHNLATCISEGDTNFTCICDRGFTGKTCDELACVDLNGTCERQAMAGECSLYSRSMERDCRKSCHFCGVCLTVECSVNRVCIVNSTATKGYSCVCPEGMTGPHCDESRCKPVCQNGGVCKEDTLTCSCPPGFAGLTCEKCVDEDDRCGQWAAAGGCEDNARTMMAFCKVSCHNCPDKPCTRKGEYCVEGAFCTEGRRCQCEPGRTGDGTIFCARKDDNVCILRGRSYLQSYGNAEANLNYPCRFRMSEFVTKFREAGDQGGVGGGGGGGEGNAPPALCSFQVFGFGLVSESGNYYPAAAEVSLALVDVVNKAFFQRNFIKFDVGLGGIASSMGHNVQWGEESSDRWANVTVDCVFSKDRFAVLSIPQCGHFRLHFRPYDQEEEDHDLPQTRPPAIVISSATGTRFDYNDTRFPGSLCGEHGDGDQLYLKAALTLGVSDPDEALLYSALEQNLPQKSIVPGFQEVVLQDATNCEEANAIFQTCGNQTARTQAIQACHGLLSQKTLLRCLGPLAMETFTSCLDVFCNDHIESCQTIRQDFRKARPLTRKRCRFPGFLRRLCKDLLEG